MKGRQIEIPEPALNRPRVSRNSSDAAAVPGQTNANRLITLTTELDSVTRDSVAGTARGASAVVAVWSSFELRARNALARFRTSLCDECSHPIHWWNRRVWVVNRERSAHLQCWNGRQFLKAYVQLMSEEIRHSARHRSRPVKSSAGTELRELHLFARALRERVERVEAQLQQAQKLAAKTPLNHPRTAARSTPPPVGYR
jgi:hypothetical protein